MATPAPALSAIMATGVLLEFQLQAGETLQQCEEVAADGTVSKVNKIAGDWVTVEDIHEIKPPQLSRKEVETTTHNKALANGDSKRTGILRRGPVSGSINWNPARPTHQQMQADARANTMRDYRIVLPPETSDDSTFYWNFTGAYSQFDVPNLTTDTAMVAKFAITLDGDDEIVEET